MRALLLTVVTLLCVGCGSGVDFSGTATVANGTVSGNVTAGGVTISLPAPSPSPSPSPSLMP